MSGPDLPDGYRLVRFDEVDSTNEEAKRLAEEEAADGTVVWARAQRAGRGRRGRYWVSPPGNLYLSAILRPGSAPYESAQLSFVAALAVADMLDPVLPKGVRALCKWPNDVLVEGRKISGILLESATAPAGRLEWLVVGVGVNLVHHPEIGDPHPSTSLAAEGGEELAPETALARYMTAFAEWRTRWRNEGFAPIRSAWLDRAHGLGAEITASTERTSLTGTFSGLDENGALILELPGGGRRLVAAGDVYFMETG